MSSDPRRFDQTDEAIERRFEEVFRNLAAPKTARPTDLPTALLFLQELWDRMSPKGSR